MTQQNDPFLKAVGSFGRKIVLEMPRFPTQNRPEGFLEDSAACHALWYYYLIASTNVEDMKSKIYYEGDPNQVYNFPQLLSSIAKVYAVDIQTMMNYWSAVDMECLRLKLPKLQGGARAGMAPNGQVV